MVTSHSVLTYFRSWIYNLIWSLGPNRDRVYTVGWRSMLCALLSSWVLISIRNNAKLRFGTHSITVNQIDIQRSKNYTFRSKWFRVQYPRHKHKSSQCATRLLFRPGYSVWRFEQLHISHTIFRYRIIICYSNWKRFQTSFSLTYEKLK